MTRLTSIEDEYGAIRTSEAAASEYSLALEGIPWLVAADFQIERVATGLELPVAIAFVPDPGTSEEDPLCYVIERLGTIKVVARNGVVSEYASRLIDSEQSDDFPGAGQQGLAGAAVDPSDGDLYVTLMSNGEPDEAAPSGHAAVERFTSSDGGLTAATRTRILDIAAEENEFAPRIAHISFGPDGYLYVQVGDDFDPRASQILDDFRGKVLRMSTSGGAASRNPFYDTSNSIRARDYVFALGLSRPTSAAWRLSDAAQYFVESGPSVDRFARLAVGRNYRYDGSDRSMENFALYNWNPAKAPSGITFVQSEAFGGSGFPAEYQGRAYVTQTGYPLEVGPGDPETKAITEWLIDGRGALIDGARAVAIYDGDGVATAGAIAAGPDGLYFSDLYSDDPAADPSSSGANIYRLQYTTPPAPVDCNENGVPDEDDLALGDDCNHNGKPDECDIAGLTSIDCNSNTVPDECETARPQSYPFRYGPHGFKLNGSAAWIDGGIRLTPATGGVGSAVHAPLGPRPLTRLRAEFDFRIGGGSGADGLSFVVFDMDRYDDAVLFGERGMGSGSLAVGLNTYDDGDGANNVQIFVDGQQLGSYTPSFSLRDGQVHSAKVLFSEGCVSVLLVSTPGEIETAFDRLEVPGYEPFVARAGFGARTGGLTDEHRIDNVTLWASGESDLDSSGAPDECECIADVTDGQGWGVPDGQVNVDDLIYFVDAYISQDSVTDLDDGSGNGTADGRVTDDDLGYFLEHLYGGC